MERAGERVKNSFARLLLPLTSSRRTNDSASNLVRRLIAFLAIYLFAASAAHAWWDLTWDERVILEFDNSLQNESLADFPVLIVLDPTNIDAMLTRAEVQLAAEDYSAASEMADRVLEIQGIDQPSQVRAHMVRARVFEADAEQTAARGARRRWLPASRVV